MKLLSTFTRLFILTFLLMNVSKLQAEDNPKTGTLIVTYQTEPKGERLDRIRFWVKNSSNKQWMYPRGKAFVEDYEDNTRMVVIEDLTPGVYTLEFLVPNTDNFFKKTPARKFNIAKGDVVKIDQVIHARVQQTDTEYEHVSSTFQEETPIQSEPFEEIPSGNLIVSYSANQNDISLADTQFKLIDESGNYSIHPEAGESLEDPLNEGLITIVYGIPPGNYSLEFFLNGDDQTILKTEQVTVDENKTKSIQSLLKKNEPSKKVTSRLGFHPDGQEVHINVNIPNAIFHLTNQESDQSWEGRGREHLFEAIQPGSYVLNFGSSDPYFIPPPSISVEVVGSEDVLVEEEYETQGKIKILTNVEHTVAIINESKRKGRNFQEEIYYGEGEFYLPEGRYQITFVSLDDHSITPDPVEIDVTPLQTKEIYAVYESQDNISMELFE